MPIIPPNATYQTTRGQGRIKVLNPTKDTLPKAGKNGTAAQFASNVDIALGDVPTKHGNTFGNNAYANRSAVPVAEKRFGQKSNVSLATGRSVAPEYTATDGKHPNAHFMDVARQVKRAPHQQGSPNGNDSMVAGVFKQQPNQATSVMPFQRNGIGANQGINLSRRRAYRAAAGGANKSLPSNTPFHPLPVKRQPSLAQTTGVPPSPDNSSHHAGKVSFVSNQNLWYDPNNSFYVGTSAASSRGSGAGRWNVIKRGAAG